MHTRYAILRSHLCILCSGKYLRCAASHSIKLEMQATTATKKFTRKQLLYARALLFSVFLSASESICFTREHKTHWRSANKRNDFTITPRKWCDQMDICVCRVHTYTIEYVYGKYYHGESVAHGANRDGDYRKDNNSRNLRCTILGALARLRCVEFPMLSTLKYGTYSPQKLFRRRREKVTLHNVQYLCMHNSLFRYG